jgi:hypothetical protein
MNDTGKDIASDAELRVRLANANDEIERLKREVRKLDRFRAVVQSVREILWSELLCGKFFGKTKRLREISEALDDAWIRSL